MVFVLKAVRLKALPTGVDQFVLAWLVTFLYACPKTEAGVQENRSFQVGVHSCRVELAITLLAVCAILTITVQYRNFDDEFTCGGGLGVGFPVSFLCDYGQEALPSAVGARSIW